MKGLSTLTQVEKIISGGQTGADQAGLETARELGLKTGGTAPPGYMTELGSKALYLKSFGLIEGEYDRKTYPKRTVKNVRDSDATLVVGKPSPGTTLTINECRRQGKLCIVNPTSESLREWLECNLHIRILNVAGNRESVNFGIFGEVRQLLLGAL